MHTASGTVRAVEPFVFQKSVEYLEGFGPMAGEQVFGDRTITKAVMVGGEVVVFRVTGEGKEASEVRYELFSGSKLGEGRVKEMEERVSFFLSLEDDVGEFYAIAKRDPAYYPKVKELWGLHHVKFPSLLEVSAWR